jgi:hypothetical protein
MLRREGWQSGGTFRRAMLRCIAPSLSFRVEGSRQIGDYSARKLDEDQE